MTLGEEAYDALVGMLRRDVRQAERLAAEHRPDGRGRCPVCRTLGCTLGRVAAEVVEWARRDGSAT